MNKKRWTIVGIVALVILAAAMIFAPWPKDESPDPVNVGTIGGPAFSSPQQSGYGAANPFR